MHIEPLGEGFAAEVSGVDLRVPLAADALRVLAAAIDAYAVLVFRGQALSDAQQIAFSESFGPLENKAGGNVTRPEQQRLDAKLNDVSNLDRDHLPFSREDRRRFFNLGNRLWHSDSSFRIVPAKFSLLSARRLPDSPSRTEFADMRAAWDTLSAAEQAEAAPLVCEHSLVNSRARLGFTELTPDEMAAFRPVRQRLVRTHPASGRRSLFLSAHAGAILGWPVPEARIYLEDLTEHATQPRFVHVHRWRLHDLVMWDNRQTMHRVRRYDQSQPRDMRRATVAGTAPTVAQQAAE
jgi:alpha-ketoglutarate-dependent 2,4-dichlorophenoxyacetate dioxygenase